MPDAASISAPPQQSDPNPAATDKPSRAGRLLSLVRKLIDYAKELAVTFQQRGAIDPGLATYRFPNQPYPPRSSHTSPVACGAPRRSKPGASVAPPPGCENNPGPLPLHLSGNRAAPTRPARQRRSPAPHWPTCPHRSRSPPKSAADPSAPSSPNLPRPRHHAQPSAVAGN